MKNGMITDEYGNRRWYLNGKRHREDGPAIERADRDRWWYHHGKRHREDGPAVEYATGHREWYLNGKLHRADGPAVEWASGHRNWYLNGVEYTFTEWLQVNPTLDDNTRLIYMLRYSDEAVA